MKRKKYISEEEVKKALNISDFRAVTKEKIMDFVSIIPNVDKDVAMSIINQFPNYADITKDMVSGLIHLCEASLNDSKAGSKDVIESYRDVLETLKEQLKDGKITSEERIIINEQMISIAEKIDNVNDKDNELRKYIVTKVGGTLAGGLLIIGAVILGVKSNKK